MDTLVQLFNLDTTDGIVLLGPPGGKYEIQLSEPEDPFSHFEVLSHQVYTLLGSVKEPLPATEREPAEHITVDLVGEDGGSISLETGPHSMDVSTPPTVKIGCSQPA